MTYAIRKYLRQDTLTDKMRIAFLVLSVFISNLVYAQWIKTGKPFESKLDYYRAAKAYKPVIDTSNNQDILSYARVLYYQGKFAEATKFFTYLADKDELNSVKDLNAFHTCVSIGRSMKETEFDLKYGKFYINAGIRGYTDKIENIQDKLLIQSTCFNSDGYEDFSPTVIGGKLCVVSSRPSVTSILGKYKFNNQYFYDLYEIVDCEMKLLGNSKGLPKGINTKFHDGPAHYPGNSNFFFLTRNIEYKSAINLGIVFSSYNGKWSNWESLPCNSEMYNTQHPFYDTMSNRLYFSSDMSGGIGGFDLYYMSKTDSGWGLPINCGNVINTVGDEVFPYIYGEDLYFSSNGFKTQGGLDIFKWRDQKIYTLETLNSEWDDYGILFLSDSSGLFTTNREKGFGHDDVLQFHVVTKDSSNKAIYVNTAEPKYLRTKLGDPKMAGIQIAIFDAKSNDWVNMPKINFEIENIISGLKSEFSIEQDSVKVSLGYFSNDSIFKITIDATKEGFKSKRVMYNSIAPSKGVVDLGKIFLFRDANYVSVDKANLQVLPVLYFDLDKSDIRENESFKLDSILSLLQKNSEAKIEIKSYTDSRASFDYNLKLAEKRAKITIAYLTNKGLARNRCVFSVFGETNLVNDCGDDKLCAEQFHQLNRRVEFNLLH